MVYCDGTNWISMGSGAAASFGTLTTSDFCAATSGTSISCTTGSTGSGNVVLSASPTLSGTITGGTFSGTFSGSGASLTSIGTSSFSAAGTANSTTFLRGDNTWASPTGTGPTGIGTANYMPLWSTSTALANSAIYQSGSNIGIGTTIPATGIKADIAGPVRVSGTGSEVCTNTQLGAIRYNPTGNYFELCSYP